MELTKKNKIILLRVYIRKVCYPGELSFIPRPKVNLEMLDELKEELRAERDADPERFYRPVDPTILEPKDVHLNTSQLRLIKRALKSGRITDPAKWGWVPSKFPGMSKAAFLDMLLECEND